MTQKSREASMWGVVLVWSTFWIVLIRPHCTHNDKYFCVSTRLTNPLKYKVLNHNYEFWITTSGLIHYIHKSRLKKPHIVATIMTKTRLDAYVQGFGNKDKDKKCKFFFFFFHIIISYINIVARMTYCKELVTKSR